MTPEESNRLASLIAFLVVAFIVAIPVIAISIRFAAKPAVDALVRLREVQGKSKASDETLLLHDRRMSLLEHCCPADVSWWCCNSLSTWEIQHHFTRADLNSVSPERHPV